MKIMRFMRYDDVEIAMNRDTISLVAPAGEGESYIERGGQAASLVRVKAKFNELVATLEVEEPPPTAAPKAEKAEKEAPKEKQSR